MAEQFYTILTNAGKAAIANASALGTKVDFKNMALGDGNGNYYNPTENQTQLVKEVYRSQINHVQIDTDNPNWINLTMVLAGSIGGFTVREAGVFDTEGNLLVIGKYPETYKPSIADGSSKDLTINLIMEVSNSSVVTLKIDPSVILATKAELDVLRQQLIDYKDELGRHKAEYAIQTATGTANAITVVTGGDFKYTQGNKISFKAISNSTGAIAVNVDSKGSKPLKKLDGANATTKANKVYEIYYSVGDDCFFLLASAEGDAVAENVLAGKYFSNDDDTGITGTMPNRGAPTQTLTTQGGQYNIPPGYFSGGSVKAQFANLTPSNIKNGVNVGGVVGTFVESFSFKREHFGYFNASRINNTNPVNETVNFTTTAKGFVVIDWGTIVINSNPVVLGSEIVPTSGNITTKTKTGVVGSLTYTVTLYSNRFTLIVTSGSDANASVSYNNAHVTVHH